MKTRQPTFIDLFSGCGGLSLGLMMAGFEGLFAIEKNPDAFNTLKHNLIEYKSHNMDRPKFKWPEWLEVSPYEIEYFIKKHRIRLENLKGHVDLVAGGPP